MSEYNLKLRVWKKDADVRVYLDGRYIERRSPWSGVNAYLKANEDGSIGWGHGFRTSPATIGMAERNAFAVQSIIEDMGFDAISFAELLARIEACKTPSGNFSLRQYEKRFQLNAAA